FSRVLTGGTSCTNAVFGDPFFGALKSCYIPASPILTSVSPTSGVVGQTITINGTNFGISQGTSQVKFDSAVAAVVSWSNTQIQAIVPGTFLGTYNVKVTTAAGTSNSVPFTVNLSPTTTLGPPSPVNRSGMSNEPVNTATGNYYFQRTDLAIPGRGIP